MTVKVTDIDHCEVSVDTDLETLLVGSSVSTMSGSSEGPVLVTAIG